MIPPGGTAGAPAAAASVGAHGAIARSQDAATANDCRMCHEESGRRQCHGAGQALMHVDNGADCAMCHR